MMIKKIRTNSSWIQEIKKLNKNNLLYKRYTTHMANYVKIDSFYTNYIFEYRMTYFRNGVLHAVHFYTR